MPPLPVRNAIAAREIPISGTRETIYFQWVLTQNPDLKGRLAFEVEPRFFGRTERSPSQFPVHKGATRLTEAVDKIIVEMRESGEMARIFGQYGITEPSVWTPPR